MRFLTLFALVLPSAAFQCFSCNSEPDDDDSQPCIDQVNNSILQFNTLEYP